METIYIFVNQDVLIRIFNRDIFTRNYRYLQQCGVERCKSTWWKFSFAPFFPPSFPPVLISAAATTTTFRIPRRPPWQLPGLGKKHDTSELVLFCDHIEFARSQDAPLLRTYMLSRRASRVLTQHFFFFFFFLDIGNLVRRSKFCNHLHIFSFHCLFQSSNVLALSLSDEHVLVSFPVVPCVRRQRVGLGPWLPSLTPVITPHTHHPSTSRCLHPTRPPPPRSSSPRSFRVGYSVESRSPLPRWRAEGSYII